MPRQELEPLAIERIFLAHELSEPAFGSTTDEIYYLRRADGRRSIIRHHVATGLAETVTAEPRPAGGVGYGGGVFTVRANDLVYAGGDGRLHRVDLRTGAQRALTPAFEGVAAPSISPCGRFVAFLAEQDGHCNALLTEVDGSALPVKLSADPWYAFNPVVSPDGSRIAWQEWDQLDMPWDESRIVVARPALAISSCDRAAQALPITVVRVIARPRVSYAAPQWSPDGSRLAFTSDESGWRSIWVGDADGAGASRIETGEGEIGLADWLPGRYGYRWSGDGTAIYAVRSRQSRDTVLRVAWPAGTVKELPSDGGDLLGLQVRGHAITYVRAGPTTPPAVITREAGPGQPAAGAEVARAAASVGLVDPTALVKPEVLSWESAGGARSWGILYPGQGGGWKEGARPLLVHMHGGPTSQVPLTWIPQAQYFATRGWHYLIVNHRGGTGFGRAYQDLLRGAWGVVDLEDARSGAEHVIKTRGGDPRRVAITGGSAGGYATLWALTQQPDFWTAGVALVPLAHIYDAVVGAHRFERHYEETLFGRLPEAGPVWQARSPIAYVDRVRAPLLLFHGTDDKAVPYRQSVDFADALRRRGGTAELVSYEGEGHVFVKEANRKDLIERMERFLDKYVLALQR